MRVSGEGFRAKCPLCSHDRAFLFSTEKSVFKCFKCQESGSLVKLYRLLKVSESIIEEEGERLKPLISPNYVRVRYWKPEEERILSEKRLALFVDPPDGILPFDRSFLKGKVFYDRQEKRIIFPIRDKLGNLIAVSGRAIFPEQYPRYKVYQFSEVDGYVVRNRKHLYLYHIFYPDYVFGSNQQLIIVEGYKAALWLVERGFRAVALQGSMITNKQAELINETNANVVIFLDNEIGKQLPNNKGECDAIRVQRKLKGITGIAKYPDGCLDKSPDDLSREEIALAINNKIILPNLKPIYKRNL